MHITLICPDYRDQVPLLGRDQPLPLVPVLGRTLLDRCLETLAERGVRSVTLKAADRPDRIRAAVGTGERWGLQVRVEAVAREPDPGPDQLRLEGLPLPVEASWFASYAAWFDGLRGAIAAAAPRTPGAREHAPGVWVGRKCRLAPDVRFEAPVWIGDHVSVASGVHLGPGAVVETGSVVDSGAEIVESLVGPRTYVGVGTDVKHSIAWGSDLVNWRNGSATVVADPFLLARVDTPRDCPRGSPWYGRGAALLAGIVSSPFCLPALVRALARGQVPWAWREAVLPGSDPLRPRTVRYAELREAGPWLRRWPQLWNVVRGQFRWVGNPPLSPAEARTLNEEYELLWLDAPTGLFSLAEAMGCEDPLGDEARAHASGYAAQRSPRFDRTILKAVFERAIHLEPR